MCVFLLLSGKTRYVPEAAHVRVHQIWMGDRADDARAASYTAQDLMIVERDIGRLAKYTFDMGGAGDLLSLALSVPPWEDLHELSREELRLTNLVTTDAVAEVLPPGTEPRSPVAELKGKPMQDRFVSSVVEGDAQPHGGEGDQDRRSNGPDRRCCNSAGSAAEDWEVRDRNGGGRQHRDRSESARRRRACRARASDRSLERSPKWLIQTEDLRPRCPRKITNSAVKLY